jgi:hypothetical protein
MWPFDEAVRLKVLLLLMKNRTSYKKWNIETKYINSWRTFKLGAVYTGKARIQAHKPAFWRFFEP